MQNGDKYESNYARAAAGILATCAEKPASWQLLAAYELITGIYKAVMADPAALGYKPLPDLWFEPWEQQRDRQKDVKAIRDPISKIEALINELFLLTRSALLDGSVLVLNDSCKKPGRALKKALGAVGAILDGERISLPDGCAEGLRELADISEKNTIPITDSPIDDKAYLYFSRCVFEPESNWTARAFDKCMNTGGRLVSLCGELEKRGYTRIDCKDGKRISLDYVKQYGKKDAPVKMSWADKAHCGIEITFEELRLEPGFIWLRMPGYKEVLERMDALPAGVRDFLAANTKTCDGCRYCVQTDKTGTRPLAAVSVNGHNKCPYFPSFSLNWRSLSAELAQNILSVLDAVYGG